MEPFGAVLQATFGSSSPLCLLVRPSPPSILHVPGPPDVDDELQTDKAHQSTGLFLLMWLIFTLYMTVASLRVSFLLASLFSVLSVTFTLLVIGEFACDLPLLFRVVDMQPPLPFAFC
jgi:hypothetical protein